MEVQVDSIDIDIVLKLVLIWFLFSHVGFRTGCKLFILKVSLSVHTLFEPHILFEKALHTCPFCFSIAKGLATCRLGGVISAQKVLF